MLANCPRQFQLSLAVSELVWYSSYYVHVTIRHKGCFIKTYNFNYIIVLLTFTLLSLYKVKIVNVVKNNITISIIMLIVATFTYMLINISKYMLANIIYT